MAKPSTAGEIPISDLQPQQLNQLSQQLDQARTSTYYTFFFLYYRSFILIAVPMDFVVYGFDAKKGKKKQNKRKQTYSVKREWELGGNKSIRPPPP